LLAVITAGAPAITAAPAAADAMNFRREIDLPLRMFISALLQNGICWRSRVVEQVF
jgi:hypothetical protein